jgi:hypothetical protein
MISQPRNLYTRSETHPCRSISTFNYYQDNEPPVLVLDDKMLENGQTLEGFSMYILVKSNSDAVVRISTLYYSLSAHDLKVHQGYSDCIMGYVFAVWGHSRYITTCALFECQEENISQPRGPHLSIQ